MKRYLILSCVLLSALNTLKAQDMPGFFGGNTFPVMQNPAWCGLENTFEAGSNFNTVRYNPYTFSDSSYKGPRLVKGYSQVMANIYAGWRFSRDAEKAGGFGYYRNQLPWESQNRFDFSYAETLLKTAKGKWRGGLQLNLYNNNTDMRKLNALYNPPAYIGPLDTAFNSKGLGLTLGIIRQYKNFTGGLSLLQTAFENKLTKGKLEVQMGATLVLNYKHGDSVSGFEHHLAVSHIWGSENLNLSSVARYRRFRAGLCYELNTDCLVPVIGYKSKEIEVRLAGIADFVNALYGDSVFDKPLWQLSAKYFIQ